MYNMKNIPNQHTHNRHGHDDCHQNDNCKSKNKKSKTTSIKPSQTTTKPSILITSLLLLGKSSVQALGLGCTSRLHFRTIPSPPRSCMRLEAASVTSTSSPPPLPSRQRSQPDTLASLNRNRSGKQKKIMDYYPKTDPRTMERELIRLSRCGRTEDALFLYDSIWSLDDDGTDDNDNNNDNNNKRLGHVTKPSTRLMNQAINACARARPEPLLERAFDIYEFGLRGGRSGKRRLCPNVYTFGALVGVCARAGDADKCVELMEVMKTEYKIKPNSVVYSTAISACERSQPPRPHLALELLRQATDKNNGKNNSNSDTNNQSNGDSAMDGTLGVVGYNAAISALARGGEWKLAVQLLEEMESQSLASTLTSTSTTPSTTPSTARRILDPNTVTPAPDEVTYGTVMAACERSGEWHHVLRIARFMEEGMRAAGESVRMDGMAITSALHACQQLGMADDALRYLQLMKGLGSESENEKGDRTENVGKGGKRRPLRGPDAVAYNLAISACARSVQSNNGSNPNHSSEDSDLGGGRVNRWEDGIRLLNEMEEVTGEAPDVVAYTAAIGGCAEAGEWRRAFALLRQMRSRHGAEPNVVTCTAVISACATASANLAAKKPNTNHANNDTSDSYSWYHSKPDDAKSDDDDIRQPMKAALALLEQMKSGALPGVEPNIVTYNAAIRACAEGLDIVGAFRLMKELPTRGLLPTVVTYGSLMTACERVGNVDAASKVFRHMKEQSAKLHTDGHDSNLKPNEIIYGAAISCCRKAGQPERSLLLLRKMIQDGLSPNTATFNTVIMAQTEGGKKTTNANANTSTQKNPTGTTQTTSSANHLDRAVSVYKLMISKHSPRTTRPNRQTYNLLVRALASNGRPADAEAFLNKMRDDGFVPDVDLFTATVTAYEKNKEPMKALQLMESMREDGYNFYDIRVLDEAFKKAIRLVNVVGKGLKKNPPSSASSIRVESSITNETYYSYYEELESDDEDGNMDDDFDPSHR